MPPTSVRFASAHRAKGSRLWWWVVAAFAFQMAAWTAWFIVASRHKIEDVPLVTSSGRTAAD
jgi:hypothetical protein